MAAGTVVSRFSGYLRALLLAAALGNLLHADLFTIGNTIPNMLYILLAGGVFNAVLVPQLVRAMRNDPDGGEAYTNRIITLPALFLGAVTVVLVVGGAAGDATLPDPDYDTPALAAQRDSIIAFARYCLPQVFFYGMFVLVGQVLNARGRFGPMMWAPIANNLVSVAVLVGYLVVYGPVADGAQCSGVHPGPGGCCSASASTARHRGPAAGPAALPAGRRLHLPAALRLPRHRARPHPAAGHVDRAVRGRQPDRVHRRGPARLRRHGGCGSRRRTRRHRLHRLLQTFLIMMVPHAIITVSLATAILPRLAAPRRRRRPARPGRAPWPDAAHRARRDRAVRAAAAADRAATWPT